MILNLGITMSDDANFEVHISNIIKKAKQKIGWFCRSFRNREIEFMRKMYVSYIRPQLEYCSVLWGPPCGPVLDKIEKVQYDFLKLVPSLKNLSYSEKLKRMKITSMERRFDRYRIFYIRKMLLGKVRNIGIRIRRQECDRNGLFLEIPDKNEHRLRKSSFLSMGPKIFNALPRDLRNLDDSTDVFKSKFDDFLSLIPDYPRVDEGSLLHSNALVDIM